jgi:hypothetical protein
MFLIASPRPPPEPDPPALFDAFCRLSFDAPDERLTVTLSSQRMILGSGPRPVLWPDRVRAGVPSARGSPRGGQ